VLRNIDIQAPQNGLDGIRVLAVDRLVIEDCVITGMGTGINVNLNAGTTARVDLNHTSVRENTGDGLIANTSAPGFAFVTINNSAFIGNGGVGIHAKQASRIQVNNSVISNNISHGVHSEGVGAVSLANLTNCIVANNGGNGVQAGGGAASQTSIVRINDCDILQNNTGALVSTNGEIDTWKNNRITGNNTNGCTSCTDTTGTFQ